jgi:hypothetical protein
MGKPAKPGTFAGLVGAFRLSAAQSRERQSREWYLAISKRHIAVEHLNALDSAWPLYSDRGLSIISVAACARSCYTHIAK